MREIGPKRASESWKGFHGGQLRSRTFSLFELCSYFIAQKRTNKPSAWPCLVPPAEYGAELVLGLFSRLCIHGRSQARCHSNRLDNQCASLQDGFCRPTPPSGRVRRFRL